MNNLKRVLSLGLTGAMLSGMMLVGASAADYKDFTDKDEIKNTEAVSTMTLLGVIAGKDTGAFDPAGTVTRAEMAKMITVALHGGKDPVLGIKSTPSYSDIKGNWAESYIEYCSSQGIISGQGDGTFNPGGTVTGSQAAKMMLTAMGYDATVYNFTGVDWEINVNAEANKADVELYDNLDDLNPSEGLSRDDAAQLIYNGIQAPTMTKTPSKTGANGEVEYTYNLNGKSLLKSAFKVDTNYGQLVNVDEDKLSISFDATYANKASGSMTSFRKVATDYTEYLGYTVKVLYKANDDVVGVAPVDDNVVYTTAMSGIEAKGDNNEKVKFDGSTYTMEQLVIGGSASAGWTISNTAKNIDVVTIAHDGSVSTSTGNAATFTTGNKSSYNTVTFIDNDGDGVLEYAVIREMVPGKVTYSNSSEIIAAGTTYDRDDDNIADGIAKDDYVVTFYNPFTDNYTVEKLEKNTGVVSINADTTKYMFDGTWYHRGAATLSDTPSAGDTYDYYTYNGVIVNTVLSETNTSVSNLAMILNLNSALSNQARIMYSDGTKKIVDVVSDDYSASDVDFGSLAAATLYTVTETSKGYSFKAIADTQKIGSYTFHAGAANDVVLGSGGTMGSGSTYGIDDTAVVYVYGGTTLNDGKIMTGKQLKTLTAGAAKGNVLTTSAGFFTSKVSGLTRASIIAVKLENTTDALPGGSAVGSNYGLIVSAGYDLDSNYVQYTIWTGEENVVVKEKGATASLRPQFAVVTYEKIGADNVIEDVTVPTLATSYADNQTVIGSVYSVSDGKLWYSDTGSLDITGKTVYMTYDSSTTTADEIGKANIDLQQADIAVGTTRVPNVKFIGETGDLKFVLIDVKNKVQDKLAKDAYGFTAPASTTIQTDGTLTFSKSTGIMAGETLTITVSVPATKAIAGGTLTLTNALNTADNSTTITIAPIDNSGTAAGGAAKTVTYSVVADGVGNITVSFA